MRSACLSCQAYPTKTKGRGRDIIVARPPRPLSPCAAADTADIHVANVPEGGAAASGSLGTPIADPIDPRHEHMIQQVTQVPLEFVPKTA